MDIMELGAIGELVGGVAVIGSLIFVGIQVRAGRIQDRLAMLTALDESWNSINAQVAQSETLGAIWSRGMSDPDSLSDEEATRFFFISCQYINIHKSVWTLLRDERLSSHHERWFLFDVAAVYGAPGFSKVFESIRTTMQDDFVAFIEAHRVPHPKLLDWRTCEGVGAVTGTVA